MIQCFARQNYTPPAGNQAVPQLLYVSKVVEADSVHPRVMHKHADFIEIVLICGGRARFSVGGRQVDVQPQDVIIYNSGIIHDEISGPDLKIATYCAAIGNLERTGLRRNAFIRDDQHPVFACGAQFETLRTIYTLMFEQLSQEHPHAELIAHHLMEALLAIVWDIVHAGEAAVPLEAREPLAQRALHHIDQHYAEDISLQDLADRLNVSPFYLAHIFKECFGYSPMQYVLRRRIGEAQTLLITTDLSVTEVAARVGYDDPSHFNRLFTKNVGLPPRKYKINYIKAKTDVKSSGPAHPPGRPEA